MKEYIGIDLGTSSVKILLMNQRGEVLKEAQREYRLSQPAPGWKEIDPQLWWQNTMEALQELLSGRERENIEGIGVTGQMHTLVLLDENGDSIRPALMWNDTRTRELVAELKEKVRGTKVSYLEKVLSTGSPAANLMWLGRQEPENLARLRHFLIGPDYLVYCLTGSIGTDFCEASTSSLYDLQRGEWSATMRNILNLPEEVYPMVRGSAETAGRVLPSIAALLGLSGDVRVITGTGDNPAASIPTGCLTGGYPVLSLGTSAVLMFARPKPDFEAKGKNILFSFDGKTIHTLVQGVVQSCGSGYQWWNRDILEIENIGEADAHIDADRLGENEIIFYPHLVGDKTIYQDPSIRGAFLGLGTEVTRSDLTCAVMEGIAYGLRQLVEEMHLPKDLLSGLMVIGGGSKSRIWMQILADVLQIPVKKLEGNACAGYGMALLAAYACGTISSVEEIARQAVAEKECFFPRIRQAELYDRNYRRYLRIYRALKEVYE